MVRNITAFAAAAAALAIGAGSASAASYGFSLTASLGGQDSPIFTLTNTGAGLGVQIDSVSISIGDTNYNFDKFMVGNYPIQAPTGGTATPVGLDAVDGSIRSDVATLGFTGFDEGESASWRLELDPDSYEAFVNFRTVLFNNGGADNALVSVMFSNGESLTDAFDDATPGLSSYTVAASAEVPLPAGMMLLPAGVLALAGAAALRREKQA